MVQVAWFVAGICAMGAFWYFLSQNDYTWTVVTGLGALVFAGLAVYLHTCKDGSSRNRRHREQLATFLTEQKRSDYAGDEMKCLCQLEITMNGWIALAGTCARTSGKRTQ
jgi:hypothetical protein